MSTIPITLTGNNLGERHRYLNTLVTNAYQQNVPFESIQHLLEKTPVDKLFKIDLASKYRNVDYIMKTLENEDLLYVSRALKSLWLLEPQYSDFINPSYLEDVLFPNMVTTAVNKMRHWVQLHLKDEKRCEVFYQYYHKIHFNSAIHFLSHCSPDFVLLESRNILDKLTPRYLKLLGENCPKVAKIYYDSLQSRPAYVNYYLQNETQFLSSVKHLLKLDDDMVLDIVEKYFRMYSHNRFNAESTKYIIKNCKSRCMNKIELYTVHLLDVKTLAKYLSNAEIKEAVFKLARAEYISNWFSYKNVEPFLKRLDYKERSAFKKQVFIDKNIGEKVMEWPYTLPSGVELEDYDMHIFNDQVHYPGEYKCYKAKKRIIKKRSHRNKDSYCCEIVECSALTCRPVTYLDRLYNQYRFVGFEKTLYELRKQIAAECSSQNRQYMLLVLVSKTGGRSDFLLQLLRLLSDEFINEPVTIRAAVVRSLVKRASAWRLSDESWNLLIKFSHGLGLDGDEPEAACDEGLHAVVLRDIIQKKDPSIAVFKAFLNHFSSFTEYSLNNAEKSCVRERLPRLLIPNTVENCEQVVARLQILLDFSKTYHIAFDTYPDAMEVVTTLAQQHPEASQTLLRSLFDSRVARKQLFKENFEFIQTEASYINALRHDATLLINCDKFDKLIENDTLKHDKFILKVSLYFNENDGLADRYCAVLENRMSTKPNNKLARPIAILTGDSIWEKISVLDSVKTKESKTFAATLRANAHLARPLWNLDDVEWRQAGAKAIANRVVTCRLTSVEENLRKLSEWGKTARLALVLSERVGKEAAVYEAVVATKPTKALKAAMKYLTKRQKTIDPKVWYAVKPVMPTYIDRLSRCTMFADTDKIHSVIKADYCVVVYEAFKGISQEEAIKILCILERLLPELDEAFSCNVIEMFIREDLVAAKLSKTDYYFSKCIDLYVRYIAKFLLYCKSEDEQVRKMKKIGELFLESIQKLWETENKEVKTNLTQYIDNFISALKYNRTFFDNECVSVMPMFEMIIQRLQKFMPLHKYFDKYVQIHLTMLYYKSIRQGCKNCPEILGDEKRKLREGIDVVGNIFGKYIAHEIIELMDRYFVTVKELYKEILLTYLNYFGYVGRGQFFSSVVKGALSYNKQGIFSVVEHIFQHQGDMYVNTEKENIIKVLKESADLETKFLLYADIYC